MDKSESIVLHITKMPLFLSLGHVHVFDDYTCM